MDKRREDLLKLKSYTEEIDNELTMILQTLQWDRKQLLQNPALVSCKYDANHKVPPDKTEEHENECFLRQNGYKEDDQLLPDPLDPESNTLVKLGKEDIEQIIGDASRSDPLFKKGVGCRGPEPLSLERLQASYSADERRVIYDAVVSAVPSCHDLADLALLSGGDERSTRVILSRQEILVELRNMRRRRTKYRVAAKSRNYSDVLRDVIKTQMEHYNEGKGETDAKETTDTDNNQRDNDRRPSGQAFKDNRDRFDRKVVPRPITVVVKTEREDSTERNRDYGRERSDRTYRHEVGSNNRRSRDGRSSERRHKDRLDRAQQYGEHSRKRRHDYEARDRRDYYEESKDRRKNNYSDNEYSYENSAKRRHRHKDYDPENVVKMEPGLDDEQNHHHRPRSTENRQEEENGHKGYKHKKDKHKKDKRRDRERSRERRREDRYEERSNERIHVKQEREDSDTISSNYEKERANRSGTSKHSRHDRPYRDGHSLEMKQKRYDRYYAGPPEDIYDPDKKIKEEK